MLDLWNGSCERSSPDNSRGPEFLRKCHRPHVSEMRSFANETSLWNIRPVLDHNADPVGSGALVPAVGKFKAAFAVGSLCRSARRESRLDGEVHHGITGPLDFSIYFDCGGGSLRHRVNSSLFSKNTPMGGYLRSGSRPEVRQVTVASLGTHPAETLDPTPAIPRFMVYEGPCSTQAKVQAGSVAHFN